MRRKVDDTGDLRGTSFKRNLMNVVDITLEYFRHVQQLIELLLHCLDTILKLFTESLDFLLRHVKHCLDMLDTA